MSVLPKQLETRLVLFCPPYEELLPIDPSWRPAVLPPRGLALVWHLVDGAAQEEEFRWLYNRPPGMPLFLVLPPATELARSLPLLHYINALDPRFILPHGRMVAPRYLRQLLAVAPQNLPATLTEYLVRRNVLTTPRIRAIVRRIFECAPETPSIAQLAKRLYTSRRTLGRHFAAVGLPVPSHWLQFGRLLQATLQLQNDESAIFRIASRIGYPDGFTMSNQMKRLVGCRPTEVRKRLGWEWVVESWIRQEVLAGGFDRARYRQAIDVYLANPFSNRVHPSDPLSMRRPPSGMRLIADRKRREEKDQY